MRRMRRAVIAAVAGALSVAPAVLGLGTTTIGVRAAVGLGVANGTVTAGADHVALGTGVFPNFKSGAIDSWLPLAHAHVDNSPFAEGTASPLDTGPVGQTAAGAASRPQPQYAEARFPKADNTADTVGNPGGPYAHASAVQGSAAATATVAGGAPAPGGQEARPAQLAALDAALAAWRAEFLTPTAALMYPRVHPDAAEPDGVAGGATNAAVSIDPASGLQDGGDVRVASASFGGGSVLIRGVHVAVTVSNGGTPHPTTTVDLGQVTVGGMPVVVGSGGVALANGAVVPIDQLQAASQQLNAALAKGGLTLRAVAPAVTSSGNQVTIDATGIHVDVQQPPTAPGVPQQFVEHTVGEVFADSLAVPAAPSAELLPLLPLSPSATSAGGADTGGGTGTASGSTSGSSSSGLGGGGGTAYPPAPAAGGSTPGSRAGSPAMIATGVIREKPLWLLLLYFMWQALIIGTAVSLWWWRAARTAG
ncbi:MAG TPA: hypothetical protein VH134_11075 [Candidatus Dormibacteraeota bacterium]|nr:hypothetical protein [Candidatus Dormibacteraeota bacterium]